MPKILVEYQELTQQKFNAHILIFSLSSSYELFNLLTTQRETNPAINLSNGPKSYLNSFKRQYTRLKDENTLPHNEENKQEFNHINSRTRSLHLGSDIISIKGSILKAESNKYKGSSLFK